MTPTNGVNGTTRATALSARQSKAKQSRCKWKYISKQKPRVTFAVYGKLNNFFFFWKEEPVANCRCFHRYESLCSDLNTLFEVKLSEQLNSYSVHTHRYSNEFSTRHCSAMNLLSGKPVTDTNQLPTQPKSMHDISSECHPMQGLCFCVCHTSKTMRAD